MAYLDLWVISHDWYLWRDLFMSMMMRGDLSGDQSTRSPKMEPAQSNNKTATKYKNKSTLIIR